MKKDVPLNVLLTLLAAGAALAAESGKDEAEPSRGTKLPLSAETDHYEVVLTDIEADQAREGFSLLQFRAKSKSRNGQSAASVAAPFLQDIYGTPENLQVELLSLPDDRMLIETNNTERPDNMTRCHLVQVVDWAVLDSWLCTAPVLSPSLRYVAMEKGTALHGPEDNDKILCYDLEETWIERGAVPVDKRSPYDKAIAYNAGVVLFPPKHAARQLYRLPEDFIRSQDGKYHVTSPLLWSPDSGFVVFLSICNHEPLLTRCNLPDVHGRIRWGQRLVHIEESMVSPDKIDLYRYYREHEGNVLERLHADEIQWASPNEVLLTLTCKDLLDHPIEVLIPEVQE